MTGTAARRLVLCASTLVLFGIALRLAWLGDDAYITLRSVENWVTGNGLRWNPADRVQTYTHPLWMLLLAAARACSGEVYFTTIALGLGLSTIAVVLLLRRAATTAAVTALAVLLATTRAFGEYSTSGLETSLVFLLLAVFVGVVQRDGEPLARHRRTVLLAALLATTRLDLALLCAPAVLVSMRGLPWRRVLATSLVSGAPLLAWLVFATVWYGSPLPVTAHAKAFGVGIPAGEMVLQGLRYVAFAAVDDPVLLPAIAAGFAVGIARRGTRALALGALLYVGYVVKVGGDFMAGRFLLPPFVVAVAMLGPWLSVRSRKASMIVAALALGGFACRGVPAWLRSPALDVPPADLDALIEAQHGIDDERLVYYRELGLFAPTRAIPVFGALHAMVRTDGASTRWILLNGAVGSAGFGAGVHGHVLDPLLCDPLLARLPARDPARWRIGHVLRRIPEGYYETLATGDNRLHHPGLRAYYEALRTLTQAPVFRGERVAMAWRLATGEFDAGFRAFVEQQYYHPPRLPIEAAALPTAVPLGTFWFDEPRLHVVYDGGVAVKWASPQHGQGLRLQTAGLFGFRVRFLRDSQVVAEAMASPLPQPQGIGGLRALAGLREEAVLVPAAADGFDELWIDAVENPLTHTTPGPACLGAIVILP